MKKLISIAVFCWALLLFIDGVSAFTIVVEKDAPEAENKAAEELRFYLRKITDKAVEIKNSPIKDSSNIFIGGAARKILQDPGYSKLAKDGIVIKRSGKDLFLFGGSPRGTLYAVYTFLEDFAGCRWWTAEEESIPRLPDFELPDADVFFNPPLFYRDALSRGIEVHPAFAVKMKINGHFDKIPQELGGHVKILGFCHTFHKFLPPEKYFKKHPEWFSEINGKREPLQPCLSNEEMRQEMLKNILTFLKENPDAEILALSQNDGFRHCTCAKCQEIIDREGSPSGPNIFFINKIARDLKEKYPDLKIVTLAYRFTRVPPKNLKPEDNVVIQYSTIERSCVHPIDAPINKEIADNIIAWGKISEKLMIWDYSTNFDNYISPFPSLFVMGKDMRFYVKNKTSGVFNHGDSHTFFGDMSELKNWTVAKLLWNPGLDEDKLIKEFLEGYYGAAASCMKEYLDLVNNSVLARNEKLKYKILYTDFPDIETLDKCYEIFEKAENCAMGDKVIQQRIARARMPLDHIRLLRYKLLKKQAGGKKRLSVVENYPAECEKFIARAELFGRRKYSECQQAAPHEAYLRAIGRPDVRLPVPFSFMPERDVLDIQDNMFSMIGGDRGWVKNVKDPSASDNFAIFMPGNHSQWAAHFYSSRDFLQICKGKWRCFISVRVDVAPDKVGGISLGIYDRVNKKSIVRINAELPNAKEYRYFDLGAYEFHPGMYIWAAPGGKNKTGGVYVDRIVFIKEK